MIGLGHTLSHIHVLCGGKMGAPWRGRVISGDMGEGEPSDLRGNVMSYGLFVLLFDFPFFIKNINVIL